MGEEPERPVAIDVDRLDGVADALHDVSSGSGRPALVNVGGADGMDDGAVRVLERVLRAAVIPVIEACRGAAVDGGTDAGVMRALGRARRGAHAAFPLIGVACRPTVALEGAARGGAAAVEPHHSHLLLVPGQEWGDEAPWIAHVADVVAGRRRSVTLLANGGEIAYRDVDLSLARGRPVIVLAGTGRTADAIADAAGGFVLDPRAERIARSDLVRVVPLDDVDGLRAAVRSALG